MAQIDFPFNSIRKSALLIAVCSSLFFSGSNTVIIKTNPACSIALTAEASGFRGSAAPPLVSREDLLGELLQLDVFKLEDLAELVYSRIPDKIALEDQDSGDRNAATSRLAVPPQPAPALPYSALPLDLVGVVVNTATPSQSICLIRCTCPSKKDGIFRPGQKTFDFAEIKDIRQDGVVILNLVSNGTEFLTFVKDKPFATAAPSPPPAPPVLAKSPEAVRIEVPKETVIYYLKNLPALLDAAFASPRYGNGKNGEKIIEGFEISRIKEAGIVEQMGLRNGDVILEVNGEPLDSMATVMRLLGGIQNASRANMTVLRGGQRMSFVIDRK